MSTLDRLAAESRGSAGAAKAAGLSWHGASRFSDIRRAAASSRELDARVKVPWPAVKGAAVGREGLVPNARSYARMGLSFEAAPLPAAGRLRALAPLRAWLVRGLMRMSMADSFEQTVNGMDARPPLGRTGRE